MRELKRCFQFRAWKLRDVFLFTGVVLALSLSALPDAQALQISPTTLNFPAVQGRPIPQS